MAAHRSTALYIIYMEIRQIRYFTAAAQTLNFTIAAQQVNVAQSTLSQQIKQLETELDVLLFHRSSKKLRLTTEGEAFLHYARRILREAEAGAACIQDIKQMQQGKLHIGVAAGLGLSAVLTEALTDFHKSYPKIDIALKQYTTDKIYELMCHHDLDLALTFTPHQRTDMDVRPLYATQLVLVTAEHHPLAALSQLSLARLRGHTLILPGKHLRIRQALDSVLHENDLSLAPALEIDELMHILYLVKTGKWVTILPNSAALAVRGLSIVEIEEPIHPLPACILTCNDTYRPQAIDAFATLLEATATRVLQIQDRQCNICGKKFMI